MDSKIKQLQDYLDESKFTVVITGAGISVAAGIPDMQEVNFTEFLQFGSTEVLKTSPEHYYKVARRIFLDAIFNNGPSTTHKKLAELEQKGKVHGIITTNLDGLHGLAGSRNVAELEGSFGVNTCLKCGKRNYDIHVWNKGKAPKCECGGLLCSYPVYAHAGLLDEEVTKAIDWACRAELVILVGTVGNYGGVYWNHISPSAKIVQINPSKTQFDSMANINIQMKSDDVFRELN